MTKLIATSCPMQNQRLKSGFGWKSMENTWKKWKEGYSYAFNVTWQLMFQKKRKRRSRCKRTRYQKEEKKTYPQWGTTSPSRQWSNAFYSCWSHWEGYSGKPLARVFTWIEFQEKKLSNKVNYDILKEIDHAIPGMTEQQILKPPPIFEVPFKMFNL